MSIVRRDPLRGLARWQPFGWEPFHELETLRSEMDRMFERWMPDAAGEDGLAFIPSVEMDETDAEIHLKIEVPGLEANDLTVEVTEDSVSVKGERKSESESESEGTIRSEFHYGRFKRMIPMPTLIQPDHVEANYDKGVIKLTLPKSDKEERKSIKVTIS